MQIKSMGDYWLLKWKFYLHQAHHYTVAWHASCHSTVSAAFSQQRVWNLITPPGYLLKTLAGYGMREFNIW